MGRAKYRSAEEIKRRKMARKASRPGSRHDRSGKGRIIDLGPSDYEIRERTIPPRSAPNSQTAITPYEPGRASLVDRLSKELESTKTEEIFELSARGHADVDENYRFRQFRKTTRELRRVQSRVRRQLFWDSPGLIIEVTADMINYLKRLTGRQVKTINDLIREEHDKVGEALGILSALYGTCSRHHEDVTEFRGEMNLYLDSINEKKPGMIADVKVSYEDYIRLQNEFQKMSPDAQGYNKTKEILFRLRERMHDNCEEVNNTSTYKKLVDRQVDRLDSMATVLQHGKHFFKKLGMHYIVAESNLRRAAPAGVFIRNLLENADFFYESMAVTENAIQQAYMLESKVDDPKVFAMACRELPDIPINDGVGGAIDHANQKYLEKGVRYLLE